MGGSDQWGNIVNGVDLAAASIGTTVFGLTTPLITTASGAKMGKTAAGAVWLNADMLSPYDYWQFWRNTEDADVGRFLRLFTDLPLGRDRAAGGAAGRGDQRGEEDPGIWMRSPALVRLALKLSNCCSALPALFNPSIAELRVPISRRGVTFSRR
jgi:hypothetical protein